MPKAFGRKDFLIQDLVVSIGAGGHGSTWLPADDGVPLPTIISPIASVAANIDLIQAVRGTIIEAVKEGRFDEVARAFVAGDNGGNPAIRSAIQQIGTAVVASAAYVALGGGSAGLPDPDSDTKINPKLSPFVHIGLAVHRVTELPRLRQQLAETVAFVDKAAAALAPRAAEVAEVRAHLEGALRNLPQAAAAGR